MAGASAASSQRILIVASDPLVSRGLRSDLEDMGHAVVGEAASPAEALSLFTSQSIDLVILEIDLPGGDELARELGAVRRCPMIVFSSSADADTVSSAAAISEVFGFLVKPVAADALSAQIAIAIHRFAEQQQLIQEKQALAQSLENRKLIERAKGILMRRFNLQEQDAHKRLQQESQKRRVSVAELARKIIESEDILGGA